MRSKEEKHVSRTKTKTKRLADFPKPYRDTLAYWQAFRKLGFMADDIFVGFGIVSGAKDILHIQLATQGSTFTVTVAQLLGESRAKVVKTWKQIAKIAITAPDDEREACYRGHLIGSSVEHFVLFTSLIQQKGIMVPEVMRMAAAGQA